MRIQSVSTGKAYGSIVSRVGAYLLDSLVLSGSQFAGLFLGATIAAMMTGRGAPGQTIESAAMSGGLLGWAFWGAAAWFLNYGILQGLTGSSVGKWLLGIKVVDEKGNPVGILRSLGRTLCYAISALPFGMGFLALLWNSEGRCWHDTLCGTFVIKRDDVSEVRNNVILLPPPPPMIRPSSASEDEVRKAA